MIVHKKLIVILAALTLLVSIAVPGGLAFAHSQAVSATTFFACEDGNGVIDANSITQEDTLNCNDGNHGTFTATVQWSVTGPKGDTGPQGPIGLTGIQGLQGPTGSSGLPFSHVACSETGLTGAAQQENLLFCQSGIEADGGLVYTAAIAAATHRVIVGTPISSVANIDWGNQSITYVEFTSGLHAEYHADNVVRFYNAANQQVFQA